VHRDLKPENVLLVDGDDGVVVRITDFGIATLAYSAPSHATSLIGSPEYMAPEVVQQQDVTGAADVYSAGILLYELRAVTRPSRVDRRSRSCAGRSTTRRRGSWGSRPTCGTS
jgi:serine/threonine-protein kinase